MKCMNCNAEIPPQYLAAIRNNICPGCGDKIYTEETGQVLTELKEAMSKMPNDPEGLACWLLSNFKVLKIGNAEPVSKFYRKEELEQDDTSEDVQVKVKPVVVKKELTTFAKRAGLDKMKIKPDKMETLAKMIAEQESEDLNVEDHVNEDFLNINDARVDKSELESLFTEFHPGDMSLPKFKK